MPNTILTPEEVAAFKDMTPQGVFEASPLLIASHEALRAERDQAFEAVLLLVDAVEHDLGTGSWEPTRYTALLAAIVHPAVQAAMRAMEVKDGH